MVMMVVVVMMMVVAVVVVVVMVIMFLPSIILSLKEEMTVAEPLPVTSKMLISITVPHHPKRLALLLELGLTVVVMMAVMVESGPGGQILGAIGIGVQLLVRQNHIVSVRDLRSAFRQI